MSNSIPLNLKSQLKKIFWITVAWTLIALYKFFSAYATIIQMDCEIPIQDPMVYFKGSLLTGIVAGILGGSGIVFLWEKWLRSKPYGKALIAIFLSYTVIYFIVSMITGAYFFSQVMDISIIKAKVWQTTFVDLFKLEHFQSFATWDLVVIFTLIILQVNDKYGPGVFRDFLLGKYFQPKREERIFMFLDLRSSTTIAEKLGEVKYFNFIKDVFRDITPAILNAKGEIYQYVGDEVVISWRMENGTRGANCLNCFFDVQLSLLQQKDYYEKHYEGIQPVFKAGLHVGHVMAGEVGVVKRDIVYSGDVLNTAARIQGKCNELGVNILLSKFLLDRLPILPNIHNPQRIGQMLLRGKREEMVLYTV